MKSAGRPIAVALRGCRSYKVQAAAAKAERTGPSSLPKQDAKVSRLANGLVVASLENYSPIAHVAVVYKAGARHEDPHNTGITHCLRNAVNLSTQKATAFGVARNIKQIGGSLSCTTSREHLTYEVECVRDHVGDGIQFLSHVATCPSFKPWEVDHAVNRLKLDLSVLSQDPSTQMIEALHRAAFRNGLGNSLYMPDFKVGSHSPQMLQEFVGSHFLTGSAALVGVGVEHDQLVIFAKKLAAQQGVGAEPEKATYHGGEIRVETNNPIVHAAICTQGASLGSKDLLALEVLQQVMGTGPHIKYGSDLASSHISKAAAQGTTAPYLASSINASYSDSGLFGFQVVAQASDMDKVLKSVVQTFNGATKGGITDADVQRAKAQVKAAIHMELETCDNVLEYLATQSLVLGQVLPVEAIDAAIDSLTKADIDAVAKKVVNSGKPTMAAVGDLSHTPFLDQLL